MINNLPPSTDIAHMFLFNIQHRTSIYKMNIFQMWLQVFRIIELFITNLKRVKFTYYFSNENNLTLQLIHLKSGLMGSGGIIVLSSKSMKVCSIICSFSSFEVLHILLQILQKYLFCPVWFLICSPNDHSSENYPVIINKHFNNIHYKTEKFIIYIKSYKIK